jgi:hypothetical protein
LFQPPRLAISVDPTMTKAVQIEKSRRIEIDPATRL